MAVWPYFVLMKITLNVDASLLGRVMNAFGTTNKTKAIDLALREIDRKTKMRALAAEGLGMSAEELGNMLDPSYDLEAARAAELPGRYGKKE